MNLCARWFSSAIGDAGVVRREEEVSAVVDGRGTLRVKVRRWLGHWFGSRVSEAVRACGQRCPGQRRCWMGGLLACWNVFAYVVELLRRGCLVVDRNGLGW